MNSYFINNGSVGMNKYAAYVKKYDKMNYAEITDERARLSKEKANKKSVTKKTQIPCKPKFVI